MVETSPPAAEDRNILIVDDDAGVRALIRDVAEECGFRVAECGDAAGVTRYVADCEPHVIVLDLVMPGLDGIEMLRRLQEIACKAQIVLVSGTDERVLTSARRLGRELGLSVDYCLPKPIDFDALRSALSGGGAAAAQIDGDTVRAAMNAGELTPFFQPTVDISGRSRPIVGAEALIR